MARLTKFVADALRGHPAKDFTTRLHQNVTRPDGAPYVVFDPSRPAAYPAMVGDLRRSVDALNETRIYASDTKEHLDRLDAREAGHHQAQAAAIAELREELGNRPFLSGRG